MGMTDRAEMGIAATQIDDEDLIRELESLHRTRHETFLHGSDEALATHSQRTAELENEWLRRNPQRQIDPRRLRPR
jgi:hypothetical protein